jgi:hypothetical protein
MPRSRAGGLVVVLTVGVVVLGGCGRSISSLSVIGPCAGTCFPYAMSVTFRPGTSPSQAKKILERCRHEPDAARVEPVLAGPGTLFGWIDIKSIKRGRSAALDACLKSFTEVAFSRLIGPAG